jgi:hypothetical protein
MKIREVFARNLRRSRHARGLSQEALAHEADMDRVASTAPASIRSQSLPKCSASNRMNCCSVCQSLREARDFALRMAKFQNQILLICNACCAGAQLLRCENTLSSESGRKRLGNAAA